MAAFMMRRGHQVIMGFYLCVLLSAIRAQSMRISAHKRGIAGADAVSNSRAQNKWFGGLFGGSDVCQENLFSNTSASVQRFEYKLTKIKGLLEGVLENPSKTEAFEARRRMERFQSCFQLAQSAAMPAELKARIFSDAEGSLSNTLGTMKLRIVAKMKDQGMFSTHGFCGFYPDKVNVALAAADDNPDRAVSAQLFGQGCETVTGMVYRSNRTEMEQKMIDSETLLVMMGLKAKMGKLTADEYAQVHKHLEQNVDELTVAKPTGSWLVELLNNWFFYCGFVMIVLGLATANPAVLSFGVLYMFAVSPMIDHR